jgi:hypothetical protein
MVLFNFITVLVRHARLMRMSVVPSLIAVVFSLGLIISAAISVVEWIRLQDDLSSSSFPDIGYTLEYSWYFMLFSGVAALCMIIGHAFAMRGTLKKSENDLDAPLFDDDATIGS